MRAYGFKTESFETLFFICGGGLVAGSPRAAVGKRRQPVDRFLESILFLI